VTIDLGPFQLLLWEFQQVAPGEVIPAAEAVANRAEALGSCEVSSVERCWL